MAGLAQHEFFGLLDCNPAPVEVFERQILDGWLGPYEIDLFLLLSGPATHVVVNNKACGTMLSRVELRVATFVGGHISQLARIEATKRRAFDGLKKYTRWLEKWKKMQEDSCPD